MVFDNFAKFTKEAFKIVKEETGTCFLVNIAKFLRTLFLLNTSESTVTYSKPVENTSERFLSNNRVIDIILDFLMATFRGVATNSRLGGDQGQIGTFFVWEEGKWHKRVCFFIVLVIENII